MHRRAASGIAAASVFVLDHAAIVPFSFPFASLTSFCVSFDESDFYYEAEKKMDFATVKAAMRRVQAAASE